MLDKGRWRMTSRAVLGSAVSTYKLCVARWWSKAAAVMQNPLGTGKLARLQWPRLAPLPPTRWVSCMFIWSNVRIMVEVAATLVGVAVRVASSAEVVVAWGFLRRRDIFNEGTLVSCGRREWP